MSDFVDLCLPYEDSAGWFDINRMKKDWFAGKTEAVMNAIKQWSPTIFRIMRDWREAHPYDVEGLFDILARRQHEIRELDARLGFNKFNPVIIKPITPEEIKPKPAVAAVKPKTSRSKPKVKKKTTGKKPSVVEPPKQKSPWEQMTDPIRLQLMFPDKRCKRIDYTDKTVWVDMGNAERWLLVPRFRMLFEVSTGKTVETMWSADDVDQQLRNLDVDVLAA